MHVMILRRVTYTCISTCEMLVHLCTVCVHVQCKWGHNFKHNVMIHICDCSHWLIVTCLVHIVVMP